MEALQLFTVLMFGHWFSDFVFQSNWMAHNKSKSNFALFMHTWVYSSTMTLVFAIGLGMLGHSITFVEYTILAFGVITFVTHFVTDYITSRVTAYYRDQKRYHGFFVVIGFDQLVHHYTLLVTMLWLTGGHIF